MPKFNPVPPNFTRQEVERFWSYVDKTPGQGPKGECWAWTRARMKRGYGWFNEGGRSTRIVQCHRLAFFLTTGRWPPVVMHSCDFPPCCRPEHLSEGSHAKNTADAHSKGRLATGLRHGTKTHPGSIRRGQFHGSAKLSDTDVLMIRTRLLQSGVTQKQLAAEYKVSPGSISHIWCRRTFSHI